ncbi:conserved protein of unknown function (plasmid) [Cupriavidus taiwanensis]|uniref:Chromosome partition protein Smc n=1 Tax=Cupriavidus taiwanensis TaxID=164546 RepID=A0A375IVJ3_9BURK|nr:hypothetical protein [Cupriavidus taiwanensis]SPK77432.1 conserved protein of unknown function [Cupriavidus taiwanensis]
MDEKEDNNLPASQGKSMSIFQLTRALLATELDSAAIGRIVHAAEQIAQSRERIRTEYMIIGSYLADIHQTIYISINKRLDNPAKAKMQAAQLLNDFACRALQISKSTVTQYLQVYQRFVNSSEAVEFLNLGELTILKRSDISESEVKLLVDAKKRKEPFSRDEIIPFIERYRAANDEINTLMAQLETAKEQLAAGTAQKTELELEIKYLRERSSTADQKEAEHRDALAAAQLALDSQSNSVHALQLAVERFGREKAELEKRIAEMRVREVVKEIEVVPKEYKSISDAITEASKKLAETNAELAKSEQRLAAVKGDILDNEDGALKGRQLENRLAGIKADIESVCDKFRTICTTGAVAKHRGDLLSLRDAARHFFELVNNAAGTPQS